MAFQTTIPTMPRTPSPSLRAILSGNVRAFRKQHGYSQEQLADLCELHRTYIGSVEREERNVSLSTLEVLAEALGVSVPELLTQGEGHERGKIS
jgi:transcriptional regulator with XRE-family HTH domain